MADAVSAADPTRVADLVTVVCGAVGVLVCVVLSPPLWELIRPLAGAVLLLFCPGYSLVALLYPRSPEPVSAGSTAIDRWVLQVPPLSTVERLALGFATSIALLPLLVGGLLAATGELGGTAIVVVVTVWTVLVGSAALGRRLAQPAEKQYRLPVRQLRRWVTSDRRLHTVLNGCLVAAIGLSVLALGVLVFVPHSSGEPYTSLALLSENEDGQLVAGDYPESFEAGEPEQLTVRLVNGEGQATSYTLVVVVERVTDGASGPTVSKRRVARRFDVELQPGEQWTRVHLLTPRITGDRVRIRYLLYRGEAASEPTPATAYRTTTLWIDVEERA